MTRQKKGERGQAAVEFAIFSVALIFSLFLIVQVAWIGIQKWQFNHFASYGARVWSVHTDKSSDDAIKDVIEPAKNSRWKLGASSDFVSSIWASSEESQDVDGESAEGITYSGAASTFKLFRGQIGDTQGDLNIPPGEGQGLDSDGLIAFQTFIPMEKEPKEESTTGGHKNDNDCKETPCESGNGR